MIIITPKSPEYNTSIQEWNRAINKFPYLIAYCENTSDVSEIIHYARKHHLPIRIRSGGHNYEGYSTGNDCVVIDISKMNNTKIDYVNNTVKLDGGTKNTELYNYISNEGYPFSGGTCPTVGVSGYALGGGWGYSARKFGLGCDSLVEVELVNYKGCVLTANKDKNSDLFWALQGAGGGNFGVITSMTFSLPPKVDKVTYVRMYYPGINKNIQVKVLDTWQKWISSVDNDINLSGGLYNTKKKVFTLILEVLVIKTLRILKSFLSLFII
ncbi:FAD-binding oxidoreductase [Romboutsia sp.]|uniref:FAD-binding oxidoreductase n=1 Tax=Romboutsia sp. TaxID=1965302 RepID=UPI003F302EE7